MKEIVRKVGAGLLCGFLVFSTVGGQRSQAAVLGGTFAIALSADSTNHTLEVAGVVTGTIMVLSGIAMSAVIFILGGLSPVNATIGSAVLILEENSNLLSNEMPFIHQSQINELRELARAKRASGNMTFSRSEIIDIMNHGDYEPDQTEALVKALVL